MLPEWSTFRTSFSFTSTKKIWHISAASRVQFLKPTVAAEDRRNARSSLNIFITNSALSNEGEILSLKIECYPELTSFSRERRARSHKILFIQVRFSSFLLLNDALSQCSFGLIIPFFVSLANVGFVDSTQALSEFLSD
ncbi:hypothetical protein VNO77_02465 [Canavalia gladiata]|uniref:Uncharacterized protein n=1 Tax=Canavalia gladiata TaxID=3824 RepID=A0AAN9R334_CANGL